ncbi:MAG: NAD(P)H-hydrate dehydratase [Stenotrophobium sp.]
MDDISRRLYSAAQVRELDRRAMQSGISGYALMQRAAAACWDELRTRWPAARRIHVVCGSGNNGGDGFEIARLARASGCEVTAWQVGESPRAGDALTAHQAWTAGRGVTRPFATDGLKDVEVVVDALFGIGLTRAVSGAAQAAIAAINAAHAAGAGVLAVDVPSGLDAALGNILGDAVLADVTVTFIGDKLGLHTDSGPDCAGDVILDCLDIPSAVYEGIEPLALRLHADDLKRWLPLRARSAHKGSNGHVLLIGGNEGMAGAILMAACAALRAGAGLVTVATRANHAAILTAAQPELMCRGVETATHLLPMMESADVIAIGPGLGQDAWSRRLLARVLECAAPLVVDADALNLLAREPLHRSGWILTPHPGEAARLLNIRTADVQHDRAGAAAKLRESYGGVVVLKGAGSLIQGNELRLCPYGNPGMAAGGMGDVLTGIAAAFVAQGLSLEDAANAAVLAHALTGDRAARTGQRGLLPGDLLAELRAVVNPCS